MSSALSAFILAHRAGLRPAFPRESGDWQKYPLLLLPSPLTSTDSIFVHVHTSFWEQAAAYVQGGGVLYASLAADAAIPEMAALFGARMTDSVVVGEVTLRIVKPFGDLRAGFGVLSARSTMHPRRLHRPASLSFETTEVAFLHISSNEMSPSS